MFTVCPKCALTLVVTAADLRVAQGYVRCGRCLNVFNALARLSEERPGTAPVPEAAAPEESAPVEESTAGAEPEPVEEPKADLPQQPPAPAFTDEADTGEIEIELDASFLVTAVHGPTTLEALEETGELEADEISPAQPAAAPAQSATAAPAAVTESRAEFTSQTPAPPTHSQVNAALASKTADSSLPKDVGNGSQANTLPQEADAGIERATQPQRASLAWKVGAVALVILLLLQIVNHYRDSLASDPAVGGPLSSIYSALGVKLAPRWNIHAYDVRQLGASAADATAGQIIVRASVKNTASRAQPLPLLRVTLQDRFGNRIAARDVSPSDYLPSSVARTSLLAAGSRVDATMVFMDPGPQAVGFEIDACLRRQGGEVACAHGP